MNKEDKIIKKLIEHDERFDEIEEKMMTEFGKVNKTLDGIVNIVERLDQERIFTNKWIKRIEAEVVQHSKDIKKIKQKLKIA